MAVDDMAPKVKSDFFAILIPGSFVLWVIVSGGLVFTQYDTKTGIMERFKPLFGLLKDNWVLALVAFVIIFLVGNLLRSIRVDRVDKISTWFFEKRIKDDQSKKRSENSFPYLNMLKGIKEELLNAKIIDDIPLPDPEIQYSLHDRYNYWKMAICIESPGSFNVIQDLEGRVRMFAGMFWAGAAGILGSVVMLVSFIFNNAACSVWWIYIIFMLVISAIIVVGFSLNLKHVRSQEVISVFLAYLYLQKRSKEEKKDRVKEKASVFGPLLNMFKGSSSSS